VHGQIQKPFQVMLKTSAQGSHLEKHRVRAQGMAGNRNWSQAGQGQVTGELSKPEPLIRTWTFCPK
jgi:hypothetical protein